MNFDILNYSDLPSFEWEEFVQESNGGTLFHSLKFLSYHGEKYADHEHHLLIKKGNKIYGVMPMVILKKNGRRVARSPYGGSYGGPVFKKPTNYLDSVAFIEELLEYLKSLSVDECVITLPIRACYEMPSDTFVFGLLEKGFSLVNRDISSAVSLDENHSQSMMMTSRFKDIERKVRKSRKAGIYTKSNAKNDDFWIVLEKTFKKHGIKPTHSYDEWKYLQRELGKHVYVDVAYLNGEPVAGIGYMRVNSRVNSSFYLCQNPDIQETQALSMLIYEGLIKSRGDGCEWFDFGTSSSGMVARGNIFRFKESFGAVGQFRETYRFVFGE